MISVRGYFALGGWEMTKRKRLPSIDKKLKDGRGTRDRY